MPVLSWVLIGREPGWTQLRAGRVRQVRRTLSTIATLVGRTGRRGGESGGVTATLTRPVASTLRVGRSRGPLTLAGVAFLLYSAFSWLQWSSYISPSYDLGIFSQIADRYAHFEAPVVTILGEDFNALGDHFHPLLILLGPVYALFPTPFSLLVVQNLLFAVSVYVVTRFAMGELGRTSGLLLGGAYALSWGLQSAVEAQFHAISLAVPLLALAIVALLSRRWWWAAVLVMPLVFVKEDLGLTVALFGLILAVQWRSWWGLGVLVVGSWRWHRGDRAPRRSDSEDCVGRIHRRSADSDRWRDSRPTALAARSPSTREAAAVGHRGRPSLD